MQDDFWATPNMVLSVPLPAVGGYWPSPDMCFAFSVKPAWWYRFWVRTVLGWEWRDA